MNKYDKIKNRKTRQKNIRKENNKYINEFNQTIVNLYHSGKTYAQIHQEYGISHSTLANRVKLYSEVQVDDNTVLNGKAN